MKTFFLCLLLAQVLTGMHELAPGTVVTLAAPDLVPVYSTAVVQQNQLVFNGVLEPETEVRVLIIPPGTGSADSTEAPYGRIGPTGDDIYVQFEGASQAVSLRKWLAEEYGVELIFRASGD
jgi:hypothetical protein